MADVGRGMLRMGLLQESEQRYGDVVSRLLAGRLLRVVFTGEFPSGGDSYSWPSPTVTSVDRPMRVSVGLFVALNPLPSPVPPCYDGASAASHTRQPRCASPTSN